MHLVHLVLCILFCDRLRPNKIHLTINIFVSCIMLLHGILSKHFRTAYHALFFSTYLFLCCSSETKRASSRRRLWSALPASSHPMTGGRQMGQGCQSYAVRLSGSWACHPPRGHVSATGVPSTSCIQERETAYIPRSLSVWYSGQMLSKAYLSLRWRPMV